MPFCTFIKKYPFERDKDSLKVTVFPAGGTTMEFSEIVRQAFPGVRVRSKADQRNEWFIEPRETFWFPSMNSTLVEQLERLLGLLTRTITINDSLDESHALAPRAIPDDEGQWSRTQVGELVYRAKDYRGQYAWRDTNAIEVIGRHLLGFVNDHPRYYRADVVVTSPSSDPEKIRNLPWALASNLSGSTEKQLIVPIRLRRIPSLKGYNEDDIGISRSEVQQGTVSVSERLDFKTVIILDDLYHSGSTIKEVARACRSQGACAILGLAVTKNAKYTQGMELSEWPWG